MSLFLCQSFIMNINITQPGKYRQPQVERLSAQFAAVYQDGAATWETPVRCVGSPRSTWAQARSFGTGWPVQVPQEEAAGHLRPDLPHLTALLTSCEVQGGGGCGLQNFLLCCLDFFFSGLIWVLTMQPSIPAGQGRQAARGVCPAGGGGLWQPVPWLLASPRPAVLLCGDVICSSHFISNLSHSLGRGCHPLCWLDREAASFPVLVDCGHAGPTRQEAAGLLQPCPSLPKASLQTCKQRAASKNWPKKKLRSQHCLTKRRGKWLTNLTSRPVQLLTLWGDVFCESYFAWFCTITIVPKGFSIQKALIAMKFPLCDLLNCLDSMQLRVRRSPPSHWSVGLLLNQNNPGRLVIEGRPSYLTAVVQPALIRDGWRHKAKHTLRLRVTSINLSTWNA